MHRSQGRDEERRERKQPPPTVQHPTGLDKRRERAREKWGFGNGLRPGEALRMRCALFWRWRISDSGSHGGDLGKSEGYEPRATGHGPRTLMLFDGSWLLGGGGGARVARPNRGQLSLLEGCYRQTANQNPLRIDCDQQRQVATTHDRRRPATTSEDQRGQARASQDQLRPAATGFFEAGGSPRSKRRSTWPGRLYQPQI
ncbi:hypothetical protein B0J11DRAFT_541870 [Dendryphion nanum]|uniref:Uncharacterized protein n=1 Tax=Dendryphion nanum TaxID=256645 RepID=A0A9P9D653_9PLEO|nr:hypothetical protein B0J11DRAFT_541870 [Dendryphion nanum]